MFNRTMNIKNVLRIHTKWKKMLQELVGYESMENSPSAFLYDYILMYLQITVCESIPEVITNEAILLNSRHDVEYIGKTKYHDP
jgi:hypothetical protein